MSDSASAAPAAPALEAFDHWARPLEDIDAEICQLALVCGVQILDPGVLERMLHNDSLVCDHPNERAFEKMRTLLMMHYVVTERAVLALGAPVVQQMEVEVMAHLRRRFGEQLRRMIENDSGEDLAPLTQA